MNNEMKRNDIHRPSAIVPTDYVFVAFNTIKIGEFGNAAADCKLLNSYRLTIQNHMASTGGTFSNHSHGGTCYICGASALYTAVFYHAKSNTYIKTGQDCAQKLDMSTDNFNMFRTAVNSALEAVAGRRKAIATLAEAGLSVAWDYFTATDRTNFKYEEATISDIVFNLVKYGSISQNAMNFLTKLVNEIPVRDARIANRIAEKEAAAPVVEGKQVIEGEIVSIKMVENHFSYYGAMIAKMTVKTSAGNCVYGTMPSSISDVAARGSKVRFTATVEVSPTDPKFGFFSRPSKAVVLEGAATEAIAA